MNKHSDFKQTKIDRIPENLIFRLRENDIEHFLIPILNPKTHRDANLVGKINSYRNKFLKERRE